MANEPTLGELANIRVNPDLGGGTPGVVYDNRDLYRRLDASMQQVAQNKKEKYNQFLGNLKELYKGIGDAADLDIMTQDRPVLQKQMADLFAEVEKDPRAALGGQGYAKLQEGLAKLRFDATESAKNNLFDKAHREFLARDPDLNTPENKVKLDQFGQQPLGQRKAYTLDLPGLFDPVTLAKGINTAIKQDYSETKLSPDGKFINSESGTRYPEEQYNAVAGNLYDLPDPRSGSLRNTVQQRYNSLSPELKQKYANEEDPAKAYYLDVMSTLRPKDQVKKTGDKANPYELLSIKDAFLASQAEKKQDWAQANIKLRAKLGVTDLGGNTEYLIRNFGSFIQGATGRKQTVTIGGKQTTGEEISAPDFAKKIDDYVSTTTREGTSLDPVARTVVSKGTPDFTILLPNGGVQAVWYRKDKDGNVSQEQGQNKVEHVETIPRRTWITILSSNVPQKFRANAVNSADDYYSKHGDVPAEMKRISDNGDLKIPGEESNKTYKYKGQPVEYDLIIKKAKLNNVSPEEYMKAIGIIASDKN